MPAPEMPKYPEVFDPAWWDAYWKNPPYGYSLPKRQASYNAVKSLIPPGSSVFDYACGYATISRQLKAEKGCRIAGCDVSQEVIQQICEPTFYVGEEIRGHYDYLILSHFLEHITNPAEFVEYCKQFADNLICIIPENFRRVKEHQAMQWGSLAEFEALIPGAERVETDYPPDLEDAFKPPIYIIRKSKRGVFKPSTAMTFDRGWWNNFWSKPVAQWKLDVRQPNYDLVKNLIPRGASVFDYACGLAVISLQLEREKGCAIAGCDISEEIIRKVGRPKFYVGDTITGQYDYIIVSHFLEHITNPVELIEHCKEHGKNIIIVIPNEFRREGPHSTMAWGSLEEFERMFRGVERIPVKYRSDLSSHYHFPIYRITQQGERIICSITSEGYVRYTQNFVDSVRKAGWTGQVVIFTAEDLTLEADCTVKRILESIRSDLFNDPRWLKADLLKYFADGHMVTYMDSDILVKRGFEGVLDYEFASAWTEYDNVGDIEAVEQYLGYKLPPGRYFDAVVTARVCEDTRRFFDVWKLAMSESIKLRHGTVCAFNMAIALMNPDIQKLPRKYHFYTLDDFNTLADERIIHYAGVLGKKAYHEALRSDACV